MQPYRQLALLCCLILASVASFSGVTRAADCTVTSVGFTPINDLSGGLYLGQFQGGLYPGGLNGVPSTHFAEGRARALATNPLNTAGNPDPNGRVVLLSIGMSNTTQEWCGGAGLGPCNAWSFTGQALADARVNNTSLAIRNGAKGAEPAQNWDDPNDANYDRVRDNILIPGGLSEAQVQVVWIKQANPGPNISLPASNADAYQLMASLGDIARAVKVRYPNCRIALLSSRIYAGYAGYPVPIHGLNPEPYAYETGFSVKWLIEAQITQMESGVIDPVAGDLNYDTIVPLLAWGPYLWVDGETPRSDGVQWFCSDMASDGTHPGPPAQQKVGTMILDFLLTSRLATPWFRKCELGDMNRDGLFDARDVQLFVQTILNPPAAPAAQRCAADCNDDGIINPPDIQAFIAIMLGE